MEPRSVGGQYQYQQAPQNVPTAANSAGGRVATKAGAYGGSEVGSIIGGMVGPPIIGNVIGNLVGERVGEKTTKEMGLDRAAGQLGDDMSKVIGRRNVDKIGEITLTALGYSKSEECVCCPCLPASQVLLIVMIGFFGFNCYRLGIGIDAEWGCTEKLNETSTLKVSNEFIEGNSTFKNLHLFAVDQENNVTTFISAYPCQFGFHYLVSGASVWLAFLPFYIFTLFGNCWRQCCCCLCDPVVCCATIVDLLKRCCCECGKFSVIDVIWYSMCTFQVVWACSALYWLVATVFFRGDDYQWWDPSGNILKTVLASLILDLFLAGSEIFHKIRLFYNQEMKVEDQPTAQEMQQLPTGPQYYPPSSTNQYYHPQAQNQISQPYQQQPASNQYVYQPTAPAV